MAVAPGQHSKDFCRLRVCEQEYPRHTPIKDRLIFFTTLHYLCIGNSNFLVVVVGVALPSSSSNPRWRPDRTCRSPEHGRTVPRPPRQETEVLAASRNAAAESCSNYDASCSERVVCAALVAPQYYAACWETTARIPNPEDLGNLLHDQKCSTGSQDRSSAMDHPSDDQRGA